MAGKPAARLHDPIAHTNAHARFWAKFAGGLIGGIAVGFAVGVAAAAVVGTGGLAGPLVAGAVVVGARMVGGYVGASLGESIADALVPETLTVTGMITSGSSDVFIDSKAIGAARASPEMPMDTVSCKKDSPQILLAEGAETVFVNMGVASRKDDHTECGAKVSEGSPTVFIGGPTARVREVADEVPLISKVLVTIFNVVMIYRGLRCLPKLARQGKNALPCLIEGAVGLGMGIHGLVSSFGNPVHAATGGKFLGGESELDFSLPGPLPIAWQRFYSSHDLRRDGALGQGWSLPYAMELRLGNDAAGQPTVTLIDEQGRPMVLPDIEPGTRQYSLRDGLDLCRSEGGHYFIHVPGGLFFMFGPPSAELPRTQTLKLARLEDRNGNFIDLRHDALGRLSELTDSTGRLLALDYAGESRRLGAVRLAAGAPGELPGLLVAYRHDAEGRLLDVTDRNGVVVRRFGYDAQGLMSFHADAAGLECHYEWRGSAGDAHVARHWTNDGESYTVRRMTPPADDALALGETLVIDQLGREFAWHWNADHQVTDYIDAAGRQWHAQYNELRQLVAITEPGGATTRCTYDPMGFMSSRTDALGRTQSTGWTEFGERWRETLADGSTWTYAYSDQGNLVRETDPLGHTSEYAYDRRGLPIVVTDGKGGTNRMAWNECAQLVSLTDCSGKTTRYAYDGWGHLQAVTDAAGQRTRLTHDAMGRLLSVSLPDQSHQSFRRDAAGRIVAATDALSRSTQFALGLRGQPLTRQDAEGRRIAWHYDSAQRLQSLVNENGLHFEFVRDAADRVVEERRVGGTRVQVEYDANGWPVCITHVPGIGDEDLALHDGTGPRPAASRPLRTELLRDAVGRLIGKRTQSHHYRYSYDQLDRLTEAVKLEAPQPGTGGEARTLHRTVFAYDKLGRLIEETAIDELTGETHTLHHAHDELGNRTQTVLPAIASQPGVQRVLNYLYYGSGHLHQINLSQQRGDAPAVHQLISDIERDDLHREVARSQGALRTRFALDPLGRRAASWCRAGGLDTAFTTQDPSWRQAIDSAGTPGARLLDGLMKEYSYDPVGELRQSRHSLQGTTGHRYDATGRIEETLRSAAANSERFAYDPAGNLLDASSTAPGYVRDNLVRVFEDKRYSYDGHGRLVRKLSGRHTAQRFEWDDESRLVAVHTTRRPGTPEATTQLTRFDYDAMGRRVAKHDAFGSTRFVWEGMRLIEERRGAQVVSYVYEAGSYVPLARLNADGDAYYFHTDMSGCSEELSDGEGRLRWRARYKTWGNTVSEQWETAALDGRIVQQAGQEDSLQPFEQNLRFQGQYLDRDTGLHYNTFRFYDPDIGRFINPDPIGLAGGLNLQSYAPNPVMWIDPWGWSCTFDSRAKRWRDVLTGKFTKRPIDPSELVSSGKVKYSDVDQWAKSGGLTDVWRPDPNRFPAGGYKYESTGSGYNYRVHGHGTDPVAPAGGNSSSGPTTSIARRPVAGGGFENFRTDGTWGTFASDKNGAHIPTTGSPYP
ncbi:RHS repeat-associated core domain-containing protein [Variovorax sp. YR752]|uniref:RHS repeat-associated core domain-containing protein n=1 Tax=Variovorax sp. YR752 TaxID=1884383 RepID=UPI000BCC43C7|nr:RHS repeat-associated core domain-containing protein [Variovorax sp. YR752]SOD26337.1 RHS repeat-associated core domain-containing protein [Variovorax sp. YR752]